MHRYLSRFFQQIKCQISCCELCGKRSENLYQLCQYCFDDLPKFNTAITQGDLLTWPAINALLTKRSFDQLYVLSPYEWPYTSWITQCKYHRRFELTTLFGKLLNRHWQEISRDFTIEEPPLVLSVPMHINRWKNRGFNQAHLIAKHFAKQAKLTYRADLLLREQDTRSQVGKTGNERRKNIQQAISLKDENFDWPEHVMLVDDVVTTGATANAISALLKRQGVKKVSLFTLCIALPKNESKPSLT